MVEISLHLQLSLDIQVVTKTGCTGSSGALGRAAIGLVGLLLVVWGIVRELTTSTRHPNKCCSFLRVRSVVRIGIILL